jgi:hypothetical protein
MTFACASAMAVAAATFLPDARTRHRAIRTKDSAIARQGLEERAAAFAFVKNGQASIGIVSVFRYLHLGQTMVDESSVMLEDFSRPDPTELGVVSRPAGPTSCCGTPADAPLS